MSTRLFTFEMGERSASGISRSQVSRWETGVYHPSAPNLFRWLNACRATLGDLERVMGRLG